MTLVIITTKVVTTNLKWEVIPGCSLRVRSQISFDKKRTRKACPFTNLKKSKPGKS
jgi:hypothetical protein